MVVTKDSTLKKAKDGLKVTFFIAGSRMNRVERIVFQILCKKDDLSNLNLVINCKPRKCSKNNVLQKQLFKNQLRRSKKLTNQNGFSGPVVQTQRFNDVQVCMGNDIANSDILICFESTLSLIHI